jgi:hypothetical protein
MGATVFMLNRFRPHVITLMDHVTGEMVSAVAVDPHTSIDPERVFVVDEWRHGDNKNDKGHFAGRLVSVRSLLDEADGLRDERDMLLQVIDRCTHGPCPRCGAKRLTRIGMEWVCNAEIDDDGRRCDFRERLGFGLQKSVPELGVHKETSDAS